MSWLPFSFSGSAAKYMCCYVFKVVMGAPLRRESGRGMQAAKQVSPSSKLSSLKLCSPSAVETLQACVSPLADSRIGRTCTFFPVSSKIYYLCVCLWRSRFSELKNSTVGKTSAFMMNQCSFKVTNSHCQAAWWCVCLHLFALTTMDLCHEFQNKNSATSIKANWCHLIRVLDMIIQYSYHNCASQKAAGDYRQA